jgi:hypothetical protein
LRRMDCKTPSLAAVIVMDLCRSEADAGAAQTSP